MPVAHATKDTPVKRKRGHKDRGARDPGWGRMWKRK